MCLGSVRNSHSGILSILSWKEQILSGKIRSLDGKKDAYLRALKNIAVIYTFRGEFGCKSKVVE